MVLRALLVSADDGAIAILSSVLSEFGVTAQAVHSTEIFCLPEYKLDALVIDFDDPDQTVSIIQSIQGSPFPPLIIAILKDQQSVRRAFSAGASFAMYKPVSEDKARATLQAAVALIKRERRRCFRVPIQVPVQLQLENRSEKEGILLDLSEDGVDILTPEPICPSSKVRARFTLPGSTHSMEVRGEVAWANPNGQSGMRFIEISESLRVTFREFVASHAPELPSEDPWRDSECRLTDLSLCACYVETPSPFPERSVVELCLSTNEMEVSAEGTVQVMHPEVGMGIEFASRTTSQREEVQSLLNLLTSCPGTVPKLRIAPRALSMPDKFRNEGSSAFDDPLLDLLRSNESLSQEQFLRELQQQRSPQETVTA
ncbi:MAG: PilZ domain-containing protein [Terriglobales bacterium]